MTPRSFHLRGPVAILALMSALYGCDRTKTPEPAAGSDPALTSPTAATAASARPLAVPAVLSDRLAFPMPDRIVAIGDLHGDLEMTRRAFRLAGAIDASDQWIGGKLVVVQTGDEIDRGDGDRAILDLVDRLKEQAKAAGGRLHALSGNHELMNVALDFRYVTPGAFATFANVRPPSANAALQIANVEAQARGRAAAFAPGGPYATMLADRPIAVKIGPNIFVHGGILPKHVAYGLERMSDEVRDWLLGKTAKAPAIVMGEDGPVWSRAYSAAPGREECAWLTETLAALGATRMVMGHTVQRNGVTSACGEKGWRIDVGLSHYFGGSVQVLEIRGDAVKVLKEAT